MRSKKSHDTAEAEDLKPDNFSSVVQPKPTTLVKSSAAVPKTNTTSYCSAEVTGKLDRLCWSAVVKVS